MTLTNYITKDDLRIAYRKAKADAFFERDHPTSIEFSEYEKNLDQNLDALFAILTADEPTWQADEKLIGTHAYIPKSLDNFVPKKNFIDSETELPWGESVPIATFRLVGVHPPAFHVVTSLWLIKVGHLYDSILQPCAYGSRIRRGGSLGRPADVSPGNFNAYSRGFKQWRQGGINAMHEGLKNRRRVVAITADLRRFYHEVDPSFLVDPLFLERHKEAFSLNESELLFTQQILDALKYWAAKTPEGPIGIPVGLPASRLIANVLLEEFDRFIETELSPLYYGRYVDDVFLVLGNLPRPTSSETVWQSICERSAGLLQEESDPVDGSKAYRIHLPYAGQSNLRFAGEKQKVFSLKGPKGAVLLKTITTAIAEKSSDWRLLPDLDEDEEAILEDVITANSDASEEADNLRKSDGITVRRLAFSIRLRNFETVERHLPDASWRKFRQMFLRVAIDNIITVPGLFAYYPYIPRLLGLAVSCGDMALAKELVLKVSSVLRQVGKSTTNNDMQLTLCSQRIFESCYQSVCMALGPGKTGGKDLDSLIQSIQNGASSTYDSAGMIFIMTLHSWNGEKAIASGMDLFYSDMGRIPWRELCLDSKSPGISNIHITPTIVPTSERSDRLFVSDLLDFLSKVTPIEFHGIAPKPALFPTRPFTLAEITQLAPSWLSKPEDLKSWLRAVRGIFMSENTAQEFPHISDKVLSIKRPRNKNENPLVAVPCFLTRNDSWVASVSERPDPDLNRFFRLNRLVNHLLEGRIRPDYLVLPECSLPRAWFDWFALRLAQSGISLIAGMEYLHWADSEGSHVSNEVRMSLVTDFLGYPDHLTCAQEKATPAFHEEQQIYQLSGKSLKARAVDKFIVDHGGFRFATLICSELTNIEERAKLRGEIDALFVPEWNPDLDTFSPIVEASATDIHCYVVQSNNRLFGDSRVRAPFKISHMRDIARIRGGEADYFVIARLDVSSLRSFQSGFRSPSGGLFKPVPDGFRMSASRKTLPST